MTDVARIWSYLSTEPLLWLTFTICAYVAADRVSLYFRRHALANPVLISILIIGPLLWVTHTPYQSYFDGAQFIHFLLGPATVALAIPLHTNLPVIRRAAWPMAAALLVGSFTAAASAALLAKWFGLSDQIAISFSAKSTTAPVALGISEALGGVPTLTAVLVILTGITGAIMVTPLMNALKIRDWRARGFAAGLAAHGIGTARALQVNEMAGAFAGTALALNAIATSILTPIVVWLLI